MSASRESVKVGWGRGFILLCILLGACVTTSVSEQGAALVTTSRTSWEEVRSEPTCVIPACDETRCVLWRCQALGKVGTPPVTLARGPVGLGLPPVAHPGRWWGRPLLAPRDTEPVFEIPWHNWNTRGRFAQRGLPRVCSPPSEPFEKHHIFPQQPDLANWFKIKQIDIHAYTVPLPRSFHSWLHSGGPNGGQWNAAWMEFQRENLEASKEEIWQFAFTLMSRFGVNGQLVPYYCR